MLNGMYRPMLNRMFTHWSEVTDSRPSPTTALLRLSLVLAKWPSSNSIQSYMTFSQCSPYQMYSAKDTCSLSSISVPSSQQSESPLPSTRLICAKKPQANYLIFCSSLRMAESWGNLFTLTWTASFPILMTWLHVTWIPLYHGPWIPLLGHIKLHYS